jgi:hypothetical protein
MARGVYGRNEEKTAGNDQSCKSRNIFISCYIIYMMGFYHPLVEVGGMNPL